MDQVPSNLAAVAGYVLTPDIFGYLEQTGVGQGGEIWLADGVQKIAAKGNLYALEFDGRRYDAGNKLEYLQATVDLALERDRTSAPAFRAYLEAKLRAPRRRQCGEREGLRGGVGDHAADGQRGRGAWGRRVAHVDDAVALGVEHEVVDQRAVGGQRLGADAARPGQQVGQRQLGHVDLQRLQEGFLGEVAHHLLHARLPELRRQLLKAADTRALRPGRAGRRSSRR